MDPGSKRKARLKARQDRQVRALDARLQRIYALSQNLHDQAELDALLAAIADEAIREETRTLIETFVPWTVTRPALSGTSTRLDPSLLSQHGLTIQ